MTVPVTSAMQNLIAQNYIAILGRNPDPTGFSFWVNTLADANNTPAAQTSIVNGFGNSAEFRATYAGLGTESAVGLLYQNVLLRPADAGGLAYWTAYANNLITSGQTLTNAYAQTAAQIIYNASTNNTSDTAGINARTATAVASGTSTPTATFTLTTSTETISGSNITVNGAVDFAGGAAPGAASTYQSSDTITGAGGANTLNLTLANSNAAMTSMAAPNINGIQTINIRNATGFDFFATGARYDVASFGTGVTSINSINSSAGTLFFSNISTGTAIGIVGNGVVANGSIAATYKTSVTANTLNISGGTTAGTVTITSAGATSSTINVTGTATNVLTGVVLAASATTLTVNAATGVNFGGLTSAGLTTATISGAASALTSGSLAAVNFNGAIGTATTVDASGLTAGGVQLDLVAGSKSFKGGQGNDAVTTAALTTTTAGIIDAGAGTGDRVINNTTTNLDSAAEGAQYVNFEIFRNGAATQQDISLVAGITSVETSASGAGFSKMTAAQAAAVTVLADNAAATFALNDATGTSDLLSVTLNNATAATTASLTGVTITGFETMNVVSSGKDNVANNSLGFTAAGQLTALNLSGANKITVATANLSKAVAIDGSTLANVPASGAYTLTLSGDLVKGSVVTGSANADSLTTTAAIAGTTGDFVTYNGGAGNDLIITTLAALNNTSAANGSLKIDGGAGTTDTLQSNAGTYVDTNFQYVTGVEKLTMAGVTNVTTGGFFDANFKASGVTFTNTTADAGAIVFDASSFTGKVTDVITQTAGGGAVTDSYNLKTGSADDTITLTLAKALTSTAANVIQTNGGNDTVNIIALALNAAGEININLGSGNDIFNLNQTGVGIYQVTGGTGADTFNLGVTNVHTGVVNLIQGVGASGTFVKPAANTISTTTFDVSASGNIATDTITLSGNTSPAAVVQATDLSTVVLGNNTVTQVTGTYNASAGTFVGSGTGADSMFIYDSSTGATITYEAIVIVGNVGVATAAAGVITLT
jgi:hypothetical protein